MVDILADSIIDTLKVAPIIFIIFLLVDFLMDRSNRKFISKLSKYDSYGGAFLGLIPQCGIPVAMVKLYSGGVVTLGMLMAVFLSSSDEALIVIAAHPDKFKFFISIIFLKILIALVFGHLVNLFIKRETSIDSFDETAIDNCDCEECCDHGNHKNIIIKNLITTGKILIFLVITVIIINVGMAKVGEDTFSKVLGKNTVYQPIIAALIGMIPSCSSSVLVAQGFLEGVIGFGSLIAGLCANTGYGILVMFKELPFKKALKISILLFSISVFIGEILQFVPMFK